jgi:hypothetical protein
MSEQKFAAIAVRTVKRWRMVWTGNQIHGNWRSQKRKKETKSRVVVPLPCKVSFMLL